MFRKKTSIPEYTGFEIGKTGIIPVSVLTFQYRIGNTTGHPVCIHGLLPNLLSKIGCRL
jgi:hypothetical protein